MESVLPAYEDLCTVEVMFKISGAEAGLRYEAFPKESESHGVQGHIFPVLKMIRTATELPPEVTTLSQNTFELTDLKVTVRDRAGRVLREFTLPNAEFQQAVRTAE